jgi:hypothetical protein
MMMMTARHNVTWYYADLKGETVIFYATLV